jgi:hypothetical protein
VEVSENLAFLNNRGMRALFATVFYWRNAAGADQTPRAKRDLSRQKNSREADRSRLVCNNDDVLSARESFGVCRFCFVQLLHRVMISFCWRGLPLDAVNELNDEHSDTAAVLISRDY